MPEEADKLDWVAVAWLGRDGAIRVGAWCNGCLGACTIAPACSGRGCRGGSDSNGHSPSQLSIPICICQASAARKLSKVAFVSGQSWLWWGVMKAILSLGHKPTGCAHRRTTPMIKPSAWAMSSLAVLMLTACAVTESPTGSVYEDALDAGTSVTAVSAKMPSLVDMPPPKTQSGSYLAGRQGLMEGRYDLAWPYLHHSLLTDPGNRMLLQENLNLAMAQGAVQQAVSYHQRLVAQGVTAPNGQLAMLVDAIQRGDWAAAEAVTTQLPNNELNILLRPAIQGWIRLAQDNPAGARAAMLQMPLTHPLRWLVDNQIGLVGWWLGELHAAEQAFSNALGQDPQPPLRLVESLTTVQQLQGRQTEALAVFDRLLGQQPENDWLLQMRRQTAQDALAKGLAKTWLQRPQDGIADLFLTMAMLLQDEQFRDARVQYLQLALAISPDLELAKMQLARTLAGYDRCSESLKIWHKIPRSSPWSWTVRLDEARCLELLDHREEAIDQLESLAGERPNRRDVWMLLGDIHRNASQFADAQAAYGKAIAVKGATPPQEGDWPLYYVAGIAAEQAKDWPSAERYLKKALELSPNQPSVLNYLGYSWLDQGLDKGEAAEMIRQALSLRPNDPYITDSLAWVYYQQKRYDKAIELLERALSLVANDPVITDHYADALWQVGRRMEARYQWQRALLFKPDERLQESIQGKLANGLANKN